MSPGFVLWGAMLITFATSLTVRDSPPDYRHLTSTSTPTRSRDLQTKRSLGVRSTDSGDLWEMSPLDSRTRIVAECQISSAPTFSRLDTDGNVCYVWPPGNATTLVIGQSGHKCVTAVN